MDSTQILELVSINESFAVSRLVHDRESQLFIFHLDTFRSVNVIVANIPRYRYIALVREIVPPDIPNDITARELVCNLKNVESSP